MANTIVVAGGIITATVLDVNVDPTSTTITAYTNAGTHPLKVKKIIFVSGANAGGTDNMTIREAGVDGPILFASGVCTTTNATTAVSEEYPGGQLMLPFMDISDADCVCSTGASLSFHLA